jgi:hypothetical protein
MWTGSTIGRPSAHIAGRRSKPNSDHYGIA